MNQTRGILYLAGAAHAPEETHMHNGNHATLIFEGEDGRRLSRAQEALWKLRGRCDWICVAGQGAHGALALALAAQLPVNRVALLGDPFARRQEKSCRETARLRAYARRNLALIVSQVLFIGLEDHAGRALARCMPHASCCALPPDTGADAFTAPWTVLLEKNLPIPGKCV